MGLIVVSVLGFATIAQAQQAQASSNGGPDGKADARADFLDSLGTDKDPGCSPSEHSDAYCTNYKLAYEIQWGYMWIQYDCSSGECR